MVGQTTRAIRIDPEFKSLIPPLTVDELSQLESNLKSDGCRDPLVTWKGVLIDGHNRYGICEKAGIQYETIEKEFPHRDEVLIWIIDNQRGRRNIVDIDRIMLAAKKESIFARKAKANQQESRGRGIKKINCLRCGHEHFEGQACIKGSAKLPNLNTRAASAKAAAVGERTYDAGKMILDAVAKGEVKASVVTDIREGRAAIHRVAKDIKETRQRTERQEKRVEAAKVAPEINSQIIVGDFRKHAAKIANGSISLIFTDPPYDREASKMLPELAKFASEKLADGGSLICYVGQTQLPAALDALRLHLRYWWTIACVHAGRSTVMREYGVNAGWKAVLWFVKGTRDDNSVMVNDVMSGGEEKTHHDWQQSQSEAAYWIKKLCPADGLVCDPFLGGGTTAAAAKSVGRKWVGFEIDPENAAIASGRLAG